MREFRFLIGEPVGLVQNQRKATFLQFAKQSILDLTILIQDLISDQSQIQRGFFPQVIETVGTSDEMPNLCTV